MAKSIGSVPLRFVYVNITITCVTSGRDQNVDGDLILSNIFSICV